MLLDEMENLVYKETSKAHKNSMIKTEAIVMIGRRISRAFNITTTGVRLEMPYQLCSSI